MEGSKSRNNKEGWVLEVLMMMEVMDGWHHVKVGMSGKMDGWSVGKWDISARQATLPRGSFW